jgi:hypothetical protein
MDTLDSAVFVQTDEAASNQVVAFSRRQDGRSVVCLSLYSSSAGERRAGCAPYWARSTDHRSGIGCRTCPDQMRF